MDRKCSAGSSHRAMGIVEEAIVLLFLYFSTSAPPPLLAPSRSCSLYILSSLDFSHSISSIIIRDEVWYLLGLYRASWRRKERENKRRRGRSEGEERKRRQDEKGEIEGMKGANDCGFAGGFGCHGCFGPRDAALALCFWYINFLWMARVWTGAHRFVPYPRYRHPSPRRDFSDLLLLALFLSFVPLVSALLQISAPSWWSEAWSSPLRDRPVCLRERHRTRGWHVKKFPNLLASRPPPTGSVAPSISSNVLEKKAQHDGRRCLCPINLRVTGASNLSGGNRAIGYARYTAISEKLFV